MYSTCRPKILLVGLLLMDLNHQLWSIDAFCRAPPTMSFCRRQRTTQTTTLNSHPRDRHETRTNNNTSKSRNRRDSPSWKRKRRRQNYSPSSKHYQRALNSLLLSETNISTIDLSLLTRREQVHLIQELERADRYSVMYELVLVSSSSLQDALVEAGVVALWNSPTYRSRALELLSDETNTITLSSSTCKALFESISDASDAALLMDRLLEANHTVTIQVWNAALLACRRCNNWQVALSLLRSMKRNNIQPNEYSYSHVLQVCAQSRQVKICMSLLQEIQQQQQQDESIASSPHIYGATLRACSRSNNKETLQYVWTVLQYMNERRVEINAIHVTSFLKTCANAARDDIALDLLETFQRNEPLCYNNIVIEPVQVDIIMINTVLLACSKAGNGQAAIEILNQVKRGEFGERVEPDVVSYNTVLSACTNPNQAKALVREMQLSRRHRYGATPPDTITYTNAISACKGDVESVRFLMKTAREMDGIQPNLYMYSAAIWSCSNVDASMAMEYFEELRDAGCIPNAIAYSGVISSLANEGRAKEALSLFEEMKDDGIQPNRITFQKLAFAIRTSTQDIAKSEMLQHIVSLMNSSDMRAAIGGPILEALIRQYGAGGKYVEARRVFEQIEGPVDASCLRAMLYACSAGEPPRWEDALSLLHTSDIVEGTRGPAKVDSKALSYAMLACAKADEWEEALNLAELYGRSYSNSAQRRNIRDDENSAVTLPAFNALMAACGRCGQPGVALRLLNDMEPVFGVAPDERSYRTAIIACNQAEHDERRRERLGLEPKRNATEDFLEWWECTLSLLRRMKERELQVDPQTYSSVISACEAAGQWQRALGVLNEMMKPRGESPGDNSRLNLFCFNAAISACEKGGAWVEALELYYRMIDKGGPVTPNFVTLSSILVALDKAGQKELAQSTYEEGVRDGIVTPWKVTRGRDGGQIRAMDLHRFSAAMANAAVRSVVESFLSDEPAHDANEELVIIVGKGKGSEDKPVLLPTVRLLLERDYGIVGKVDITNAGRLVITPDEIKSFVERRQWRESRR